MKITYETPMGSFDDWFLAAEACERADMDPTKAIKVVRTENGSNADRHQARMRAQKQKSRFGRPDPVDTIDTGSGDWGNGDYGPVFRPEI